MDDLLATSSGLWVYSPACPLKLGSFKEQYAYILDNAPRHLCHHFILLFAERVRIGEDAYRHMRRDKYDELSFNSPLKHPSSARFTTRTPFSIPHFVGDLALAFLYSNAPQSATRCSRSSFLFSTGGLICSLFHGIVLMRPCNPCGDTPRVPCKIYPLP
ncbi:hypothetical protein BDN70DRAFT_148117 [Pholiota conissans]|uniref:Uncharacterized protein n=1 Tax=Pholiota conissans TaxID=109636 RepID=A0A9P6CXR9_9AGAR|nr:hypothetical protein BDN70DRAFT_148117 [Pholiota conissans]